LRANLVELALLPGHLLVHPTLQILQPVQEHRLLLLLRKGTMAGHHLAWSEQSPEVESPLHAELELLKLGMATVVKHGRRWYLKEKGAIGVHSDPLQRGLEQRIRLLEQKVSRLIVDHQNFRNGF